MMDATANGVRSESGLTAALEEYLAALEAGQPPAEGECLACHPHVADELRSCLASLAFIRQAAPRVATTDAARAEDSALLGTLGDFRLLREVGRGGMGVVYEAE